jgi:hypothetical protein
MKSKSPELYRLLARMLLNEIKVDKAEMLRIGHLNSIRWQQSLAKFRKTKNTGELPRYIDTYNGPRKLDHEIC